LIIPTLVQPNTKQNKTKQNKTTVYTLLPPWFHPGQIGS